jgi:hypothetical protein
MADYLQPFSGLPSLNILLVVRFSPSSSLCQILGWSVLVRVDGLTYPLLGGVLPNLYNDTVNFTSIAITPTQTVASARAGPMQVNLTFLNPIEVRFSLFFYFQSLHTHHLKPQDWVKQSIPFSYMAFTANSLDGASHAVQVYSDVSGGTYSCSSKVRLCSLAWLQSGTQGIDRRRSCGARRPMPMSSITVSHSRHRYSSPKSSTKRNGVVYIMP